MSWLPTLVRLTVIVALVVAPAIVARYQIRQTRALHVVRPGVLYRSAQLKPPALRRLVHDLGVRTVINLRDGSTAVDRLEEEFCNREEVQFVRIPPRNWVGENEAVPAEENVQKFLEVMRDPRNHPVLIHCFAGIHRTGAFCAIYRMEFEGWDRERALRELKECGYTMLEEHLDVYGYLQHYRPGVRTAALRP